MSVREPLYLHEYSTLKLYGYGENKKLKLITHKSFRNAGVELDAQFESNKKNKKSCSDDEKRTKLENNIYRACSKIREYALCNEFSHFCTFTFSPEKVDRNNLRECRKSFTQFISNLSKKYKRKISYLLVPEQHKDGSWHFHGLVNGLPECELHQFVIGDKMGKKIADKVKKGETVYNWLSYSEKFGFCSLEPIKDIERCGVYITKYLTKDINAMKSVRELGEHLYFHSKGLNKALVLKKGYCFDIPIPDYINEYVAVSWHDYSELNDLLARFIKHEHVLAGRYRTAHKILNPVSKLDFLISKANECGIPVFSV